MGDLAGYVTTDNPDGLVSFDFVQSTNLVSFFDNSDAAGKNWNNNYKLKTIKISKTYNGKTVSFDAIIADTCGNLDCNGCCSINAKRYGGYLVDMEYYTVLRNFGSLDAADGSLTFTIV